MVNKNYTPPLIDTHSIRRVLLGKMRSHLREGRGDLFSHPADVKFIYQRKWKEMAAKYIFRQQLYDIGGASIDKTAGLLARLDNDISKVILSAAAACWISIDSEFKLEKEIEKEFPEQAVAVPKDLNYGIITCCYEPMLRMASYLSDYTSSEEREYMPEVWLKDFHNLSMEFIERKFPHKTKQQLIEIISELSM